MIGWTNEQIDAFLQSVDFCEQGRTLMNDLNNYGLSLDEAADRLRERGYREEAAWVISLKHTPMFVKQNGSEISVEKYKTINFITNETVELQNKDEVKAFLIDQLKQLIVKHNFNVKEEHEDENGNTMWADCNEDFLSTIVIE
jgi:hypothetical protein